MNLATIGRLNSLKHLARHMLSSMCLFALVLGTTYLFGAEAEAYILSKNSSSPTRPENAMPALYTPSNVGLLVPASERRQKKHYSRHRKGLIYGGKDHKQFLGCIGCGKYNSKSICNPYSAYGSKYNSTSLFNEYSNYGSKHSRSSPWNLYGSSDSTPILVDDQGRFYGYFTSNPYRSQAFSYARDLQRWYKESDGDLETFQQKLCAVLG